MGPRSTKNVTLGYPRHHVYQHLHFFSDREYRHCIWLVSQGVRAPPPHPRKQANAKG